MRIVFLGTPRVAVPSLRALAAAHEIPLVISQPDRPAGRVRVPVAPPVKLAAGDKLALWYASANRDEEVFERPFDFDVRRTPNEHVGFGGPGPHFCLGANLARREIRVMFRQIFDRLPDLEITGEPERLASNFVHGIKRMPCRFTPGPRTR